MQRPWRGDCSTTAAERKGAFMNRPKTLMLSALAALAVLGCSDTAYAQPQLSVTPSSVTNSSTPLVFSNIPSGSASQPQIIALSASSNTSVIIQVSQAYPWLSVSPTVVPNVGPSNPVNLSVRVNTNPNGQILAQGTY